MTVPKTTTVVLRFWLSISAARVMTVVLPTPGMPTIMARLLFSAKQSRQTGHVCIHLLFDQRLIVTDHDVYHKQNPCSSTKDSKHVRNAGQKSNYNPRK